MEFSGRIKAARLHLATTLDRKVTQKQLGEMCGDWSQNRISNYEAGTRAASSTDCLIIADITGVRIEWLQLESGPMLQAVTREEHSYYEITPPIIDWDEIDRFIANPLRFDRSAKLMSPFRVNHNAAFAVALPYASTHKYHRPKTAIIVPVDKDDDLSDKEVMCRDKNTGEKALKIYSDIFGAISLIDSAEILPPIALEPQGKIEIIGRVVIKYE
jgi:transcriptional regulator with XRE-family HTH domain